MKYLLWVIIATIVCFEGSKTAEASKYSVTVSGSITDVGGHAIPRATILFTADDDTTKAVTDNNGRYILTLTMIPTAIDDGSTPAAISLSQNYPNPFNPTTTIEYAQTEYSRVSLTVYSISGQHVRSLVDNYQRPGHYRAIWDGCDENGRHVSAGVYLYRLRSGVHVEARKMVLVDGGHAHNKASTGGMPIAKTVKSQQRTYEVVAYKGTMPPYTSTETVDFTAGDITLNIGIEGTYYPPELFIDTVHYNDEFLLTGDDVRVIIGAFHEEDLPPGTTAVLTSGIGDSETVNLTESGMYVKNFDDCRYPLHFQYSMTGSIATHSAAADIGNGVLEVDGENDTITITYDAWPNVVLSSSATVIDELETVVLWDRAYYKWGNKWLFINNEKWLQAQTHDFYITFDATVDVDTINDFIINNDLEIGHKSDDYSMTILMDNPIAFLIDQHDNPIIQHAELFEVCCGGE